MNLLLDTHVWIWSQECPERLGERTRRRILDPTRSLNVCTVSTLEIARLIASGALALDGRLTQWVERSIELLQAHTIEVSHAIAIAAYALPADFHKDPADRILVATARTCGLELLTADERILDYPHAHAFDARL